jgi:hypothetical protein
MDETSETHFLQPLQKLRRERYDANEGCPVVRERFHDRDLESAAVAGSSVSGDLTNHLLKMPIYWI